VATVLLDLDGTLVDSASLITTHLAAAISTVTGMERTPAELLPLVGPPFETRCPSWACPPRRPRR
jgi:phosphoglycolate phosphatase-like HAD superfamily hydrolase